MCMAHRISHRTNVVVGQNQSENSKILLLLFDWMLTMTTFVPWDILWAMVMFHHPALAAGSYSSGPPAVRTVGTKSTGGFYL